ncbi:MAG: hypothetical protein KDA58_04000, partial [Planctomycetaceae bacterium]|nr:hypothetical protein [Planctomycetaceae bacterium]
MSYEDDDYEDDAYGEETLDGGPRKRRKKSKSSGGMSTTVKVLLGLAVFMVVGMVVCCGVGIFVAKDAF